MNGTGISVDLARLRTRPDESLADHPGYGLAQLDARVPRDHGLGVALRPLPENHAHAEITGTPTKAAERALARAALMIFQPAE